MSKRLSSLVDRVRGAGPEGAAQPWLRGPSIYAHVAGNVDPESGRLKDDSLPDDERRWAGVGLRWVAGGLDGTMSHHVGPGDAARLARRVARSVARIARRNPARARRALYALLVKDGVLGFVDQAMAEIARLRPQPRPHLYAFAVSLARCAPDRGPAKFGLALLGVIGDERDRETMFTLGLHDEFTLFAAVALSRVVDDPEAALWELAQRVDGWGRVHLVERLASTRSPRIKDWLLRQGYRNRVMDEYLAYACATGGDLKAALAVSGVDDELLDAAGDLLRALIAGGPAEDISQYRDAAPVVSRYLALVEGRPVGLRRLVAVDSVLGYLTREDWDEGAARRNGWDGALRASAIEAAERIVAHPGWPGQVAAGLAAEDDQRFHVAATAAGALGIDTWEAHWARLQGDPQDGHLWSQVMEDAGADRVARAVDLATRVLPLDQVATGPADEMGMGPGYQVHFCVEMIVARLGGHPGVGWPLVEASLASPSVRGRYAAVRTLAAWGRDRWPPGVEQALAAAREAEPREDVRESMDEVLRGGPLEPPSVRRD